MKTLPDAPLKWKSVGGTRLLLRLWQKKDEFPQVCLLRVSNSDYLKFSQDPKGFMKFVNDQSVFSKDVIEAGPWVSLSSVDHQNAPIEWILTLLHGKASTMVVSALPRLIQKERTKK